MKGFILRFITIATLAIGSVVWADSKTNVITGRVVEAGSGWMDVQNGKKRLTIETEGIKDVLPRVGDTVRVYYTPAAQPHYRFDPGPQAIKIEIIAAGSKK